MIDAFWDSNGESEEYQQVPMEDTELVDEAKSLLTRFESEFNYKYSKHADPEYPTDTFSTLYNEARSGDVNAQYNLGAWYQFGYHGCTQDKVAAMRWYIAAAKQMDPRALNNLGALLFVDNDHDRAIAFIEVAAIEHDYHSAALNLSVVQTLHRDVKKRRYAAALKYLKELYDLDPQKQVLNNLACMECRGLGCKPDYPAALLHFKQAAIIGCKIAAYNLGVMFKNGLGVDKNDDQAQLWFDLSKDDPKHEEYKSVMQASDITKLLLITSMNYYV
eukprot:TRINITY_DN361_c0_g1_i1.p2 TRINITY_DN361_c0_g1~~TRINITY_DN361_c0_g1_i1.p2  ORF type:complete len:275 (-),score=79.54 TRINITY_DN361_c0_g1_i1:119-943(-)